jgi:aspartate/methionine/tyrosine aminotransferase
MPTDSLPPQPPLPLRPEVADLEPSKIVALWQQGFGRDDLIPLWVGEGDLTTPQFICDAATKALRDGHTFYTHKRGWPELREALDAYHGRLHGVRPGMNRLSLTSAGMNGIQLTLQAILRSGDEMIALTPVWPNALSAARIHGGVIRDVPLAKRADGGFTLDADALEAAIGPRTRAIFLASPSNPTGWTASEDDLRAVIGLCRKHGVWLIADEVYHRFVYDRAQPASAPSVLGLIEPEDPVIVVNSFSKTWAMTGWRLAWLVHPPSLAPVYDSLIEFNTSGAPAFLQAGALAAIRDGDDFAREMIQRCGQGRELVLQRLGAMRRVTLARPEGAFYAFFKVKDVTDSLAYAQEVLERTGVGLAPGSAFGDAGEGHLRLCFSSAPERLSAAMDRLASLLDD